MSELQPRRNLVLVERLPDLERSTNDAGDIVTAGGIIIPKTCKYSHPAKKHSAKPDFWRGRVIACGPLVRELAPGDEVLVHTWAEVGDGLYTGADTQLSDGRCFLEYPDDFVCALEPNAELAGKDPTPTRNTSLDWLREPSPEAVEAPAATEPDPFPEGHPFR